MLYRIAEVVEDYCKVMKLLSTSIVCLLLVANVATGQNRDVTSPEPATRPTLEEVKAAGVLRSSFLKQLLRTETSEAPRANLKVFHKEIEPVLKKACVRCHGTKTQEGNIRIDTLDPNLLQGADVKWWLEVAAVLTNC